MSFHQFHWFLKDLKHTFLEDGFILVAYTDVPCHLFCRMTRKPPLKHALPSYRRGIFMQGDIRFCFTVYEDNEQEEEGDTMIHTFIKPAWPICETRWFYFIGSIAGEWSVSESPIFKFHFKGSRKNEAGNPCLSYPGSTQENQIHMNIAKPVTEAGFITKICFSTANYPNDHYFYVGLLHHVAGISYVVRDFTACFCDSVGTFTFDTFMFANVGDCLAAWGLYASLRRTITPGVNLASGFYYANPLIIGKSIDFPNDSFSDPLSLYAHGFNGV